MHANDVKDFVKANAGEIITVYVNKTPEKKQANLSKVMLINVINRNTSPILSFSILEKSLDLSAAFYNIAGVKVAHLVSNNYLQGNHSVVLDFSNLKSLTYICKVKIGNETSSKKPFVNYQYTV